MSFKLLRKNTFQVKNTLLQKSFFTKEEGPINLLELGESYENLEDREIETTMKFGGTFIDVTAKHLKSGKSVKTILTFD